jgi:hypothetical protein
MAHIDNCSYTWTRHIKCHQAVWFVTVVHQRWLLGSHQDIHATYSFGAIGKYSSSISFISHAGRQKPETMNQECNEIGRCYDRWIRFNEGFPTSYFASSESFIEAHDSQDNVAICAKAHQKTLGYISMNVPCNATILLPLEEYWKYLSDDLLRLMKIVVSKAHILRNDLTTYYHSFKGNYRYNHATPGDASCPVRCTLKRALLV